MTKIIDIIPPNINKSNTVKIVKKEKIHKKGKAPKILIALASFLVVGFIVAMFVEGKGTVTIYPVTRDVSFEEVVYIEPQESEIDLEKNILPGEYFDEKLSFEDTYEATGYDESATKAEGVITVCGEFSGSALKLVKNTRFLSAEGSLTYKAVSAFTVPSKTTSGPGCVEVDVIADEAGDKYNITSGTFSIPGLQSTDYYTTIWGELKGGQKIEGGSISEQKVITEKDLVLAEDLFKEKYLAAAKGSLISNLEEVGTYVYFDEGFNQTFDKFIVLGSEGDKVNDFKIEATITTKVLIFRKSDVDNFVEKKLLLSEENRSIVPNTLIKEFVKTEDLEDNAVTLKVSAQTYSNISKVLILNDVKGQELEDCKNILKDFPEIKSADVFASLFWKNKLPSNKDNINIEINFDN
ncbi:MAG: hypothetical protein PHG24_01775 [Candidatus Pacebacteria bacterium]|nr:hypothetical protein [Candidatus Paceibacterota bacterium]